MLLLLQVLQTPFPKSSYYFMLTKMSIAKTSKETDRLSFSYQGINIPVTYTSSVQLQHAQMAIQSDSFQKWITNLLLSQSNKNELKNSAVTVIDLNSVEIQSVDMFGSRVGFIKMKVNCTSPSFENNPVPLPGICFLRGSSVGVLVILRLDNKSKTRADNDDDESAYCILVEQPRIPVGESNMLELPAGMIDDKSHSFAGTAARELQEECGIKVNENDLTPLTGTTSTSHPKGICPSPGGCDEYIHLFYYEKILTKDGLINLQGKLTGIRDHGEIITLRIFSLNDVWKYSCDAKLLW